MPDPRETPEIRQLLDSTAAGKPILEQLAENPSFTAVISNLPHL
jgi:hypothetical protein